MTRFAGDLRPVDSQLDRAIRQRQEQQKIPSFSVDPGALGGVEGPIYFDPTGKQIRRGQMPAFAPEINHAPGTLDKFEFMQLIHGPKPLT
jgi:hypothetical protein